MDLELDYDADFQINIVKHFFPSTYVFRETIINNEYYF